MKRRLLSVSLWLQPIGLLRHITPRKFHRYNTPLPHCQNTSKQWQACNPDDGRKSGKKNARHPLQACRRNQATQPLAKSWTESIPDSGLSLLFNLKEVEHKYFKWSTHRAGNGDVNILSLRKICRAHFTLLTLDTCL